MSKRLKKPIGWWTTHPTILTASVHGLYDSDGDGLGDFEGIRQKLDYFTDMGISGYRFQHVGVYGDDYKWEGLVQQDWYNVDPHYGSMEDFERLMKDCDEKDIKVMMMAVPEYVGWQHPDYLAAKTAREKGIDDPRINWFVWKDDGTVLTRWDRPAPDISNPDFMDAYLDHIGFWMDKGIAGWDADAVFTWQDLDLDTMRRFNEYIIKRGGLVTDENLVLEDDVTKYGGFNAGTGFLRHELYNEIKAIVQQKASYIREGLKVREELIRLGMFPYQQFGDQTYSNIMHNGSAYRVEMIKLQAAFNAVLPDQIWILGSAMALEDRSVESKPTNIRWGTLDWAAMEKQEKNPDSLFAHLKRMFSLRAQNKELAIGDIEEVSTNHEEHVFAAIRTSEDGDERALVVFNFSGKPKEVVIHLQDDSIRKLKNYLSGEEVDLITNSLKVKLHLYGYKLFKIIK